MCIRDRVGFGEQIPGYEAFSDFAQRDDRGLVVLAVDPVSYTHLRAHETVLDLVCRLLLEKKKTILQSTTRAHTTKTAINHVKYIHL